MFDIATIANIATILSLIVSLLSFIWITRTKQEVDKIKISINKTLTIRSGNTTNNIFLNNAANTTSQQTIGER